MYRDSVTGQWKDAYCDEMHMAVCELPPQTGIHFKITLLNFILSQLHEPRLEKTGLRGFRPGQTQTGLCIMPITEDG